MKNTIIIRIAILMLFILYSRVISQPPICNVECPQIPFNVENLTFSPNCPDCQITLTVHSRCNTCLDFLEVIVTNIVASPGCYTTCGLDVVQVFQKSFEYAILNNSTFVNSTPYQQYCPKPIGCRSSYVARNVACWSGYIAPDGWHYEACDGLTDCCWYKIIICRRGNRYVIDGIDDASISLSCGEPPPDNCYYICDWIYYYLNPESQEFKGSDGWKVETYDNITKNAFIITYPEQLSAQFSYQSELTGKIELKIFDEKSALIKNISGYKKSWDYSKVFDTSEMSSGIYLFQLFVDGKLEKTGKFIIVR